MTNIKIFQNEMFGAIRTMNDENGKTFFVGKDVAMALGYSNTRKALLDHVDSDDRTNGVTIRDAIGRDQRVVVINESGVYALIFASKLEQAKAFKHWVTSEVLPQIRQTGGYIPIRNAHGEVMTEAELVAKANLVIERTIARKNLLADDCFTATQIAQLLDMNVTQLNKQLASMGVQYWDGGRYKIAPKFAECGYSEDRKFHYYALDGVKKERSYLVWTPVGKKFIVNLLMDKVA